MVKTVPQGGARPGAGRPKGSKDKVARKKREALGEMARAYTDQAIEALLDVAKNGQDGPRVSAATALLDRGWGRPVQAMEHSGPDGGPVETVDWNKVDTDTMRKLMAARTNEADSE